VPLDRLLDSVTEEIDLVAVSAVQSSDGRVIDLDRLAEVARHHDVRTFVDATQAAGWLPLEAGRFDVTACHGYKWLCSPRGAGFLTVSERSREWLKPVNAGWYAGEDPWTSIYGPPLRLARDARRLDVSPAWFSYSGAAEALELLADLGPESVGEYSVGLANRFRESVGLEPSNSAIVSLDNTTGHDLAAAGFSVAHRANRVRLSFYLYNTDEDADRAAKIVTG
ncbi:MAG: aminotransferase class V-fold PLP-dependent enzyme, partial [Acidimicrobiia bacterium]|nr:aminotransferase class V-fold PLP-dependent enzyme [Acidimicrobiia bacterium]